MPDLVDTSALHQAVDQLAQVVASIAAQAGAVPAVQRLQNDVERLRIDSSDCAGLASVAPSAPRQLEIIPDAPYDASLWQGVDDEGLGGFHPPAKPHTRPRSHR